jgi:spore maturation protein CgeB
MSFKLLIVSTLYPEYLKSYYQKFPVIHTLTYQQQYKHLLDDAAEFVSSYTRNFNRISVQTQCIISNALPLQNTWRIENGIDTKDEKTLIYHQIKEFEPDVLWIENIKYIEEGFIHTAKSNNPSIKLVIGYHCAPYNSREAQNFKLLNFVLTCTPGFKQNFEQLGIKSYLVYHAFDPEILSQLTDSRENTYSNNLVFSGSLFLGGGFHDKRTALIEKIIEQNIDIKIYCNLEKKYKLFAKKIAYNLFKVIEKLKLRNYTGRIPVLQKLENYSKSPIAKYSKQLTNSVHEPVFGLQMLNLLKDARIALNIHGEVAGNYAGNMRLFEATGVGTCLLTDYKENISDLFDINSEIVVYKDINDCIEKIKWLLDHPVECGNIAKAGQKRTLASHSVGQRCNLIAKIIEDELNLV